MHVILGSWGRKVQNLRPAWAICSETVCLTLSLVSQSSKQSCTHRAMCFSLSRLPVVQGWPWECLGSACSLMLLSAHAPAPSSKGVSFSLDFSPGEGKRSDCVFPTSFASSRIGLVLWPQGLRGPSQTDVLSCCLSWGNLASLKEQTKPFPCFCHLEVSLD